MRSRRSTRDNLTITLPTGSTRDDRNKVEPFSIGAGFARRDRRFCLGHEWPTANREIENPLRLSENFW